MIPVGSVANLRSVTGNAMVSWATAPVLAVLEHGHRPMVTLSKWLQLYAPGIAFSPALSASNSLLSPSFTSAPGVEHITIEDERAVSAALPCLDFATTPTYVTCTRDASTALPPQPDSVDLAATILPQRRIDRINRIIDQLHQQHEREMSRLEDEHQSQLQVLKAHHDTARQMRDNTHNDALRDLRTRVTGFDAQLQDLRAENQRM